MLGSRLFGLQITESTLFLPELRDGPVQGCRTPQPRTEPRARPRCRHPPAPPSTRQGQKRRTHGCFALCKERGQQVDAARNGPFPKRDAPLSTPANGKSTRRLRLLPSAVPCWLLPLPCPRVTLCQAVRAAPARPGTHSTLITVSPIAPEV